MTHRVFRFIAASPLALTLAGCMTVGGAVYHPDRTAGENLPLYVAMTDASYAVVKGRMGYVTYASAFSRPMYHEVKMSMFQFPSDGKSAVATYSWNGANQKTMHTLSDWLSPGIAYGNGVIAFKNSNLGSITGDRYVVRINWGMVPAGPFSMYWRDLKTARQFVDSMLAVAAAAGPQFAARFFNSALLPDGYPSAETAPVLPGDATRQAELARRDALAGSTDESIALYSKIIASKNEWAAGHYDLAMLYLWENRYGDAVREMNVYLALAPNFPNAQESERLVSEWQSLDEASHP